MSEDAPTATQVANTKAMPPTDSPQAGFSEAGDKGADNAPGEAVAVMNADGGGEGGKEAASSESDLAVRQRTKKARLKAILVTAGIVVCCLGLIAGAGAAIVGARPSAVELNVNTPLTYYPLPDLVGNLAADGTRTHRVRITVTLEVDEATVAQIKSREATIISATQDYLRELTPADMAGRQGAENLRSYIRDLVNDNTSEGAVRSVLFTTLIVD